MHLMGDNLTKFAGSKFRYYIEKYTSNPILGAIVSLLFTGLIQSSSGTTVIIISLVSAGYMQLKQAIPVILGANVGTTVTAILIGFNIEYLSYFYCDNWRWPYSFCQPQTITLHRWYLARLWYSVHRLRNDGKCFARFTICRWISELNC